MSTYKVFPPANVDGRYLEKVFMTPAAPEFATCPLLHLGGTAANGTWPSANDPIAMPFRLTTSLTVVELGWRNGSGTMTDSFDIGIYDTAWNRLVSGGGTARSGVSLWQWVDVSDTVLPRGRYYLACSNNGVTTNNMQWFTGALSAGILKLYGVNDSATDAYPLPDPLTNMGLAATFTRLPFVAIAGRAHFA